MSSKSEHTSKGNRRMLQMEELEERIAPVIVTADPGTWIEGWWEDGAGENYNAWGEPFDGSDADWYSIFYVGSGQADIRNTAGGPDLTGYHIGDITITGSDETSGLFILQRPVDDEPDVDEEEVPWVAEAGTLWVQGDITVDGDIGCIEIDGQWAGSNMFDHPVMTVDGTLGKFDVGQTIGDIYTEDDIWEIHVDTTLGYGYDEVDNISVYYLGDTEYISAKGNIGSIIVGAGLVDNGDDPAETRTLGGFIGGNVTIRANSDDLGDPGIIDLVRVYSGALIYTLSPGGGSLGIGVGEELPVIDPGPGGNVRFVHIDGEAFYSGPAGYTEISTEVVGAGSSLPTRTIVDDSGGVMVINPESVTFPSDEQGWTYDDFQLIYSVDISEDDIYEQEVLAQLGITGYEITWYDLNGEQIPVTMSATPIGATEPVITYFGFVEYMVIPLARGGSAMARMVASGNNSFNISGNVEIGDFAIGVYNVEYPEGFDEDFLDLLDDEGNPVESIDDLELQDPAEIIELSGYAHDVFNGTGECDIYFLDASQYGVSRLGGISSEIPIVLNNTHDGDIVGTYANGNVIFVGASHDGGDIGATESISPYLIRSNMQYIDSDILWVDNSTSQGAQPEALESNLMRYDSIQGVLSDTGNIYGVRAGGAIGDVRAVVGNIRLVIADSNRMRDPGSPFVTPFIVDIADDLPGYGYSWGQLTFNGRAFNDVGDGVFGKIFTGQGLMRDSLWGALIGEGFIGTVKLGEGLNSTGINILNYDLDSLGGIFVSSGIYSVTYIDNVIVTQYGIDENGIYGDIIAQGMDELTGFALNRIAATGGAVIDGSGSAYGYNVIAATTTDSHFDAFVFTGTIGKVMAQGSGAIITDTSFYGNRIHNITTTGGTDGFVECVVFTDNGGLDKISIDGPGIIDSSFFVDGTAGLIQTTGSTGVISGTEMKIQYGLRSLKTWGLEDGTYIEITTLGKMSRLDHMTDSTLIAGGLHNVRITNDMTDSTLQVAGPLRTLTVGGEITDSTIAAVGIHGDIGRITVKGDITGGEIYSERNINIVQSQNGSIDTDITALGSGDLDADLIIERDAHINAIKAAGNISGTITVGWIDNDNADLTREAVIDARLGSVRAGGNISADINVGVLAWTGDITSDADITAAVGSITADGNIAGDILVGSVKAFDDGLLEPGDINGNVSIAARLGSVGSKANISGDITAGYVSSENDVNGDVDMNIRLGSIKADGSITGDILVGGVDAANDINGDVHVPEVAGVISSGGSVTGDVGLAVVDAGNDINGDVVFDGRLAGIRADGDVTGDVRVGSYEAGNAVNGTVSGSADAGSIISGGSVTGDFDISGRLGSLRAEGDVGNAGGTIDIGGKVGSISAGSRDTVGDILSDVSIGGNLSSIRATGAFPGSLSVGGNTGRVSTVGDAGELGDTFDFGGRVGRITVGNADTFGDLLADVTIADKLGALMVTGDIGNSDPLAANSTFTVGGNLGRAVTGRIFSDVHVMGDLSYLQTGSGLDNSGVVPPVDYDFINPGLQTGHLTVDGIIRRIV